MTIKTLFSEKYLHTYFDAGILLKAVYSVGEIILGFAFLFLNTEALHTIAGMVFGDEIQEFPLKPIWDFLVHSFSVISNNSQNFLAFIFLGHGIIKIILIVGLAKEKFWVFPLAGIAFTLFGIYQIYQLTFAFSILLLVLTIIDALFVALIIHEYRYQKKSSPRGELNKRRIFLSYNQPNNIRSSENAPPPRAKSATALAKIKRLSSQPFTGSFLKTRQAIMIRNSSAKMPAKNAVRIPMIRAIPPKNSRIDANRSKA